MAKEVNTKYCPKCKKTMREDNFYKDRRGNRTEYCKKCLTMHVDNFKPETFLWILEKLDIPYIENRWVELRDKAIEKNNGNLAKLNGTSVLGRYISSMRLNQWNKYSWADTERLQKEAEERDEAYRKEHQEELEEFEKEAQEKYDKGEISEAEYLTYMGKNDAAVQGYWPDESRDIPDFNLAQPPSPEYYEGSYGNPFNENNFLPEEVVDVGVDLTEEDKIHMAIKWGRMYQPHEWVELEQNYQDMKKGFDIQDPDTENTLKHLCKTNLKMNQAIDSGDIDGFQKLSRVYDSLRKSAKFTALQNKEDKEDFIDCVGNLVTFCEKNGGKIMKFKLDYPLDIIDKIIKDMKNYTRSLVYEDVSLARQVEQYLANRINMEKNKKDRKEALERGQHYVSIDDKDIQEYNQRINDERFEDEELIKKEANKE